MKTTVLFYYENLRVTDLNYENVKLTDLYYENLG
jgi:hypothetical protein